MTYGVQQGNHGAHGSSARVRRREFVKLLAGTGAVMGLLAACGGQTAATATTAPAATQAPAATTAPAAATAPTAAATAAATTAAATAAPTAAATAAPAAAAATPTAKPAASIKDALKINLGNEPDTIDPQKASFVGEISVIMRVFSNLLTFDDKGQLVPEMAAAMPKVSSDGKTYTFTLKDGLKYSDGKPLTAQNFEYAWKRHMDPTVAGEYAFTGYAIAGAQEYNTADPKKTSKEDLQKMRDALGVKATDDKTLTFTLKEASPWFLSVLATWCGVPSRQDMVEKGGDTWTEPATYIGNGPYVLKTWDHQSQMVFQANPNYVGGPPPIQTVQYLMISEPTVAFAAYQSGDLDVFAYAKEQLKTINADPNLSKQKMTGPGVCSFYMGFNNKKAPFDNPKVRQAFSLAIDRKAFVSDILGDIGIPANQFIPQKLPGHYDDLKDTFQKFDPEQAKKLLADAGYPGGKGLPQIKWTYSQSSRNQIRIEALAGQIKNVLGVTIGADPVEPKAYTALTKAPATTPPLFLLGWCQDYPDPQDWYTTVFRSDSTSTHTGYKDDQFDKLVTAGDHELDAAKRAADYKQAAQLLNDDVPVAFIWWDQTALLVKPAVQGYTVDPTEYYFGQHKLYSLKYTPSS